MSDAPDSPTDPALPPTPPPQLVNTDSEPPRRGFLYKALAAVVGAIVVVVPAAAGLFVFADPIVPRKKDDEEEQETDFIEVGPVSAVPDNGAPHKFVVRADLTDAWTMRRDVAIGSVYVRRTEDGSLQAFTASCPHLGCAVSPKPDGSFGCPCHDSEFNPDGTIKPVTSNGMKTVSLRGLDELDVDESPEGMVRIRFQKFRSGIAEKVAV